MTNNEAPLLTMRGITKSFPGVLALDGVSFEVRPGTVHALCGENGAGKSTLMKILNGIYQPDAGEIIVKGEAIKVRNPIEARHHGIAMIAQELNYVPNMSIAENFFLGRLPGHMGKVDWRHVRSEASKLLAAEGLDYRPSRKLGTLTVSEIQMLEIMRAVYYEADVIVMDEPTSAIAHKEIESLFEKINRLRDQGKGIVYISHKMDEVFELADDVSVLRDGKLVSSHRAADISPDEVIALMVGREFDRQSYPKEEHPIGDTLLEIKGLSRKELFEDINMTVKRGEIVGLAGLVGAGRSEVVRAVYGLDPFDSGEVIVDGEPLSHPTPAKSLARGVAMLSEDRRLVGIIPMLSIKKNATLASLKKFIRFFTRSRLEESVVRESFQKMRVKAPTIETKIESLSGGNQQKVLLARWLIVGPKVLMLDEPTRGIDVGAKYEIYKIVSELAAQGEGILMISSELPELMGMCDRIYVMSGGRITGELLPDEYSQETILKYAMDEVEVA